MSEKNCGTGDIKQGTSDIKRGTSDIPRRKEGALAKFLREPVRNRADTANCDTRSDLVGKLREAARGAEEPFYAESAIDAAFESIFGKPSGGSTTYGQDLAKILDTAADRMEALPTGCPEVARELRAMAGRVNADNISPGGYRMVTGRGIGLLIEHEDYDAALDRAVSELRDRLNELADMCDCGALSPGAASLASVEGCVRERIGDIMPEGMEWPRFKDGEPVKIGDAVGRLDRVDEIRFDRSGATLYQVRPDGLNERILRAAPGERVERPDSWDAVADDATLPPDAYCGKRGLGYDATGAEEMAADIVARCKRLAGVE